MVDRDSEFTDEQITIEQRTMEKVQIGCQMAISRHLLGAQACVQILDYAPDRIEVMVKGYIWGEKLGSVTVSWPMDWWQALKLRFAPHWLTRRWPVEFAHRVVDCKALYPDYKAIFPDQRIRFASFVAPEYDRD